LSHYFGRLQVPEEAWKGIEKGTFFIPDEDEEQEYRYSLESLSKSMQLCRTLTTSELEKSLRRAIMREAHELILDYCEETGQENTYKKAPFYWFATILRNTVSHKSGGKIRKWPDQLTKGKLFSVSWDKHKIDKSMLHEELAFHPFEVVKLFHAHLSFVRDELG
jgi:hypothetical protein